MLGNSDARSRPGSFLRMCRFAFALVMLLVAALLGLGGYWLVDLDGSSYYLIAAGVLALCGLLILFGNSLGAWLFLLLYLATIGWAVSEAGTDIWGLAGRLSLFTALGLWMITPIFWMGLTSGPRFWKAASGATSGVLIILTGLATVSWIRGDVYETLAQAPLPEAIKADLADRSDWVHWGNDLGGLRFSPLTQIGPENVSKLEVAWEFHTGDYPPSEGPKRRLETTPIAIGDTLYLCTARNSIVALDAETGEQRWRYDPVSSINLAGVSGFATCRGVAYYRIPDAEGMCSERIFGASIDSKLVALDAKTGLPCPDFGEQGTINLKKGMGEMIPGSYYVSSTPQVARGKIVLGGWISNGQSVGEASGVIRAFDAVTGQFVWAFDMGRPNVHTEPGPGEEYTKGTPNSWAPMSADDALGLVFAPIGNAAPYYYGGRRRSFDEEYSSSVIALDADTGSLRWSFQTTHHDLWDYDVSSQPTLTMMRIDGVNRSVLLQPTKRGEIFVLDPATGEPLSRVEEKPVPTRGAPPDDKMVSSTQPFSVDMPAFAGIEPTEKTMWGVTLLDQLWCRIKFKQARYDGTMTPPGLTPSINYPGSLGGIDWGGVAVDPERRLMVVNSSSVPTYARPMSKEEADKMGLKPASPTDDVALGGAAPQEGVAYAPALAPFQSPLGAPCVAPPYGMLSLVDLDKKRIVWNRRLGTAEDSGVFGIKSRLPIPMGLANVSGSLVTRSGLIFIAASQELSFRAIDLRTGDELWKAKLPAGGHANPMTYLSPKSGRQFVVIAAGGHDLIKTQSGDSIIGYALTKK